MWALVMDDHPQKLSGEDKLGAAIALALLIALSLWHTLSGKLPHDQTAYIYAADLFSRGLNPYTDERFLSPFYEGYPYVYLPFTRWALIPLSVLPALVWPLLDATLRALALALSVRELKRRFTLGQDWPMLLMLCGLLHPIFVDALVGNVATCMFAALLGLFAFTQRAKPSARDLVIGLLFGLLMMIKLTWMMPALVIAAGTRRLRLTIGIALGGLSAVGLSLINPTLFNSWLEMLGRISARWPNFDTMGVSHWLFGLVWVGWSVVALRLFVRRQPMPLFLWACASAITWPRQSEYDFILMLPLIAYLYTRLGLAITVALCLPALLPLSWLLKSASLLPAQLNVIVAWGLCISCVCGALLWADKPARQPKAQP